MGLFDWIRRTVSQVTTAIETGLRGIIELHKEIAPYIPTRPATEAQIEEAMEGLLDTQRFIAEELSDEALRLARGVRFYEPLTNVARLRHWTAQAPQDIPPSDDYYISVRRVVIGPDGAMSHVDIRFGAGEVYTEDEMTRRAASALENEFVDRYDVGRSEIIRQFTVAQEAYIERFKPL